MRQTDRQLYRADPFGGFQCRPSTVGSHHQARKLTVAFLAGRSSTSSGTLGCGLETPVHAPGDASAKKYCQGGDGPKTRGPAVLDVAERLGVCAVGRIRFERGTARNRTWRELERCPLDWASRSLVRGSLK